MAQQKGGKLGARLREQWGGVFTRSAQRVENNLGIINANETGRVKQYRSEELERLDQYFENRQYDKLADWLTANQPGEAYIPVRQRKPLIAYPFARVLCQRITSKLVSDTNFPRFQVEDDPDTTDFIRVLLKSSKLRSRIVAPVQRMLASGSVLLRFSVINGQYVVEHFLGKYCYPIFDQNNNLESVTIKYVYKDVQDVDRKGEPKKKWYRLDLGKTADILYDNPECRDGSEPIFTPVATAQHGLGFVQAEWLRTCVEKHSPDGPSIYAGVEGFIDEMNYSMSQSSNAVMFNQDPQLFVNGLDEAEMDELIRSSAKSWNLGKEGKAGFLESNLGAVERASELRDKVRMGIQDITRVIFLDPDKIIGSAQSGKAMEVLHGPMVELILEIRPELEERLSAFILKMMVATLKFASEDVEMAVSIPEGYQPQSLDITADWPDIFPQTTEDLQKKVALVNTLTAGNIFSREWGMRFLAKDFGVENIEEELAKVAAQPVINPFGGF